jgi:hypothetical protein
MEGKKFVTAINCMDGRVQLPVIRYLMKTFAADYVDTITEPGPDKILGENKDSSRVNSIKERIGISLHKHHSDTIAIVSHQDCAGNPVDKQKHCAHLVDAVALLRSCYPGVRVVGLWVDEAWEVHKYV